jgi:hypothetical protein
MECKEIELKVTDGVLTFDGCNTMVSISWGETAEFSVPIEARLNLKEQVFVFFTEEEGQMTMSLSRDCPDDVDCFPIAFSAHPEASFSFFHLMVDNHVTYSLFIIPVVSWDPTGDDLPVPNVHVDENIFFIFFCVSWDPSAGDFPWDGQEAIFFPIIPFSWDGEDEFVISIPHGTEEEEEYPTAVKYEGIDERDVFFKVVSFNGESLPNTALFLKGEEEWALSSFPLPVETEGPF